MQFSCVKLAFLRLLPHFFFRMAPTHSPDSPADAIPGPARMWCACNELPRPKLTVKLASSPYAQRMDSYKNASDSVLHRASRVRVAALGLISLLVSALIFAQTLGLMHQLAHGPHDQGTAQAGLHDHQAAEETGIHESDWLETLFASHEDGSNSCRVFDQQGQTALMTAVASLALPSVFRAALPLARITCHPTSAAASFEARAPPFSR